MGTIIESMTVKSVRYYETSNGVGYEAKTNEGSIWNDGRGGPTYFRPKYPEYTNKDFGDFIYDEKKLESMIDAYEENLC